MADDASGKLKGKKKTTVSLAALSTSAAKDKEKEEKEKFEASELLTAYPVSCMDFSAQGKASCIMQQTQRRKKRLKIGQGYKKMYLHKRPFVQ